jgi:hypothetical protein
VSEVLAALSLVTDLARGRPPEEAMRACLLAVHLGRRFGLQERKMSRFLRQGEREVRE